MCSFPPQSDWLDLVDYSGLSGPVENVGGDHSDINAYDADHFQPFTDKHSHLRPEIIEPAGPEGTIIPSTTTTCTCLIHVAHALITLFY